VEGAAEEGEVKVETKPRIVSSRVKVIKLRERGTMIDYVIYRIACAVCVKITWTGPDFISCCDV
jgi:hypothetical protein